MSNVQAAIKRNGDVLLLILLAALAVLLAGVRSGAPSAAGADTSVLPYQDPSLPVDQRVADRRPGAAAGEDRPDLVLVQDVGHQVGVQGAAVPRRVRRARVGVSHGRPLDAALGVSLVSPSDVRDLNEISLHGPLDIRCTNIPVQPFPPGPQEEK